MGAILTIVVPCYNVEDYLENGLSSYADRRFAGRLEVLIINDGSTDGTREIAARYVSKYPEIFRLIDKENGGHGSAVNAGIAHATGKYFRVIDGDDWVHTDHLHTLLARLDETDADMVVDEKREVHMDTGRTQHFPIPEQLEADKVCNFTDICTEGDIGSFIMIHTLSVRTDILQHAGIRLLEHIFYVDYEYIVKATVLCQSVLFLRLEIYQYLVGNVNQSVSSGNYVKRFDHHTAVTKEMLRFATAQDFTGARHAYLQRKVQLIIHTHYNIALIFDKDRKRGMKRARAFHAFLKEAYPEYEKLTRKRYHIARILHLLRFDAKRLDQLMGRA